MSAAARADEANSRDQIQESRRCQSSMAGGLRDGCLSDGHVRHTASALLCVCLCQELLYQKWFAGAVYEVVVLVVY